MTTRRNIIKSGAGLAAIIATGKAPAYLVKSMLSARNSIMAAKLGGWVNPYVTNGLVAMWDGIGNIGWENHDSASQTWVDLIGGNNLAIDSNYASWGDDCLNLNSANVAGTSDQFGASGLASSNVKTIEFVCRSIPNGIRTTGIFLSTGYKARGIGGFGGGWIMSGVDKSFTAVENGRCKFFGTWYSGLDAISLVYNSDATNDDVDLYTDGVLFTGTTTLYPSPAAGPFVDTMVRFATLLPVHCIRIYNRAITAAEIAANYAVDKARFNLA